VHHAIEHHGAAHVPPAGAFVLDRRAVQHRVRDDPRQLGTPRRWSRAHRLPQLVHLDVRSACSFERCQGRPVTDRASGHERRRLGLVERFSHRLEQPLVSIDVQTIEEHDALLRRRHGYNLPLTSSRIECHAGHQRLLGWCQASSENTWCHKRSDLAQLTPQGAAPHEPLHVRALLRLTPRARAASADFCSANCKEIERKLKGKIVRKTSGTQFSPGPCNRCATWCRVVRW
jgi:hypothetical protein